MNAAARLAPMMSSEDTGWRTPSTLLALVRQVGHIELDPSADLDNWVGADRFYTPADNGLVRSWACTAGLAYCNPPYGRALKAWALKIRTEAEAGHQIVALVPARTDTRWWGWLTTARAICFWRGRLRFVGAPGPAPFPSALLYWGPRAAMFREVFGVHGWIPGY